MINTGQNNQQQTEQMQNMIGYLDNQIREVDQLEIPAGNNAYLDQHQSQQKNSDRFGVQPLRARQFTRKKTAADVKE